MMKIENFQHAQKSSIFDMKKTIAICALMLVIASMFSNLAFAASSESSNSKIIGISLVNQDPDPALAGNIVEIRLGVENSGGGCS